MALFNVTLSLLEKKGSDDPIQGRMKKCVQHLTEKIIQVRSRLESKYGARPIRDAQGMDLSVIWEQFDPVGPEEVDRVLGAVCRTSS